MSEDQIKDLARVWLGRINEPSPQLEQYARSMGKEIPFDIWCSLEEKMVYIEIVQNTDFLENAKQMLFQNLSDLVHLRAIEQAPLIIVTQKNDECCFGFLVYWDNDKCYLNNNICWHKMDEESLGWLKMQLKAHWKRLAFLPDANLRVIKTISIDTPEFVEAEIIYLRKFNPEASYIMKTSPALSDQERFNRLLMGTPQSEYPEDDLDRSILSLIRSEYPDVSLKSNLLLFDVDLLKFRHIKDKKINTFSIKILPTIYNEEGHIIGYENGEYGINLEMYYYPNVFKSYKQKPIVQSMHVDHTLIPQVQQLLTTIEPLSSINI